MLPVLFSIGSFHLYSLSVFLILSWVVWSCFFWRYLRNLAVKEDSIFDIMFYATIISFLTSRLFFVATHIPLFSDTWLKIVALWVQPGLSFTGGIIGAVIVSILLGLKYKVRIAYILDGFTHALSWGFMVASIGVFLDGAVVGKITTFPWGVVYIGHIGLRHPTAIYECIYVMILTIILWYIIAPRMKPPLPYGQISMWFFMFFAIAMFLFEFLVESDVYWGSLSANQWIYVGILGQAIGAFYVRGGGKEKLIIFGHHIVAVYKRIAGGIYGKLSKRDTERHTDSS
jgi:phosphatidylglycerol:prolipoprotein diacylglycerol transferase